jgi:hypothetical protein
MSDEEFAAEMGAILSFNKDDIIRDVLNLVSKKLEDAQPPTGAEIIKAIENNGLIHRMMLDWADRWVANEIGNRLRCGIWEGRAVDRLFDSIWTEQFDIAIKDRIRQKVNAAIDVVVKERLIAIQSK